MKGSSAAAALALGAALAWGQAPTDSGDPRSRVLLDLECRSGLARSRLTWFANGTVRRKEETGSERHMWLGELGPEEAAAYRERVRAETAAAEVWHWPDSSVEGEWIERCLLEWRVEDAGPARRHEFSRLATLPLALGRLLAVTEDLKREADLEAELESLPLDYLPRAGDVLRRIDGTLFRVVGWTDDRRGIELSGVTVPLTLFVLHEELRREFVALVSVEGSSPR